MANAVLSIKILSDASRASKELDRVAGSTSRVGSIAKKAAVGVGVVTAGLLVVGKRAVSAAADLEQSSGAIDSVFRKSAGQMHRWARDASTSVGLTANEFNELGTLIGSQLKNGGTAMDQLAPKTNNLIRLGADLSSMFGGSTREAVEALSSALKGERDPIERYGVTLNQAKIDAEAAALGFKKVDGALSAQATQAATLSLVMKQTADAQGNFARESNTLAHQQQVARAQIGNLTATLGTALTPALATMATQLTSNVLPPLQQLAERYAPKVGAALQEMAAAAGPKIKAFLTDLPRSLAGLKSGDAGGSVSSIAESLRELGPAIRGASSSLPSFVDLLKVSSTVLAFAADHTDTLVKIMPLLVAGYAAVKVAQFAANVAAVASVPTKIAEVVVNRQLVASNRALIASRGQLTAATVTNNAAESTGILTKVRSTVVTIAKSTAEKAAAAAARTMAAAQWLLNAAMTANPIGIVVVALIALVAGLVIAYKRSETFRNIVNGAFAAVMSVVRPVIDWFRVWIPKAFGLWVNAVKVYINVWRTIIVTVFRFVRAYITTAVNIYRKVITTVFRAIVAVVRTVINTYRTVIVTAFNTVKKVIGTVMGAVRGIVSKGWQKVKDLATSGARNIVDAVTSVPGKIRNLGSKFLDAGKSLIQALFRGLRNAASGAAGLVTNIANSLQGAINDLLNLPLTVGPLKVAGKTILGEKVLIPRFARGGITDGPTLAVVGDNPSGREAIIPSELWHLLGRGGNDQPIIVQLILDGKVIDERVDRRVGRQARRIVMGGAA